MISRPMPTQTISLGTPSAASLINTANGVVTLRHTSADHKEVSLFTLLESQDRTYHRLWRSQLTTTSCKEMGATLTAVLPLEFNSLVFGYSAFGGPFLSVWSNGLLGDGHLRHTSFSALTSQKRLLESPPSSSFQPAEAPLFQNTSNIPIPASILSLHLIRNERTGDRFIIGGSDDGGIAVWSLQYDARRL